MVEGAKNGKSEAIKILLGQKSRFGEWQKMFYAFIPSSPLIVHMSIGIDNEHLIIAKEQALIHAADVGSDAVINRLLDEGANPSTRDTDGASLLEIAACNGHLNVVKSLLKSLLSKGYNLSDFGHAALSRAAEFDHLTIVKLLLEKGVTLRFSRQGDLEILRKAVENNYSELVNLLLAHSQENTYGISLNEAAKKGDESVVDLLLLLGATADDPTLQEQAMDDHESAIQLLLDHDAQHPQDPSSLQKAAAAGHELIVKLLLRHGATIEVEPREDSALHKAVIKNYPSIVKTLLEYGADANAFGSSGTPLLLAAQSGYEQIVDLLLERGASTEAENENGTPLEIAARNGHLKIVERLISRHPNTTDQLHAQSLIERLNQKRSQGTVLQCAAAGGHKEIVNFLLSQGADINVQSGPYGTALQAAVVEGKVDMVKILRRAEPPAEDFSDGGNKRWDKATSKWVQNEYLPEPQTPLVTNGNTSTPPPQWDPETLLLSIAAANARQKKKKEFKDTASSISWGSSTSLQSNGGLSRLDSKKALHSKDRGRGSYASRGRSLLIPSRGSSPSRSPPSPSTPRGHHRRLSSISSMGFGEY
jgi:ankyrin repeat protein